MWRKFCFFVVAYDVVVCGLDFNAEVDGLFVVAYGMVVRWVDFNVEVCGWFVCSSIWVGGLWGRLECQGPLFVCGSIWVSVLWVRL